MVSDVFFVNGTIEKCDGNYLRDFRVSQIQDSRISIGAYPQNQQDVAHLKKQGITAVVNLMTDVEIEERNVHWGNMQNMYQSSGINIVQHCPIDEQDGNYDMKLFESAQMIQNLLEDKHNRVFVHCGSGISRGPSAVLTHLCLYKKVNCWEDIDMSA
jgi:protein tyrosine phosphatase (PTP) superfamily phosphohydrolase (DUF442 family)